MTSTRPPQPLSDEALASVTGGSAASDTVSGAAGDFLFDGNANPQLFPSDPPPTDGPIMTPGPGAGSILLDDLPDPNQPGG